MIYLARVLSELNDLRCSVPATLIGGIVDRGFSRNGVDLLCSDLSLTHQRVVQSLSPELRERLHLVPEGKTTHPARPPRLVVGGATLWDYAQRHSFYGDELIKLSTQYWIRGLEVEGKSVLDAGCGDGFAMHLFLHLGAYPTGISTCEEDVIHCREQGLEVYLMDQNLLDFDDESFDIVWSHYSLEHSVAPILALRESSRVLQPNGILDLTVDVGRAPGHHYRFGKQTLENMLLDSGFSILNSDRTCFGFSPTLHLKAQRCGYLKTG